MLISPTFVRTISARLNELTSSLTRTALVFTAGLSRSRSSPRISRWGDKSPLAFLAEAAGFREFDLDIKRGHRFGFDFGQSVPAPPGTGEVSGHSAAPAGRQRGLNLFRKFPLPRPWLSCSIWAYRIESGSHSRVHQRFDQFRGIFFNWTMTPPCVKKLRECPQTPQGYKKIVDFSYLRFRERKSLYKSCPAPDSGRPSCQP